MIRDNKGKIVFVVEAGWRALREESLRRVHEGLSVDVIIKGKVSKEVLEIISRPNGYRIWPVPREFFRLYLFFYLLRHKFFGDLKEAIVSKEKTRDWCKGLGVSAKLLIE